MLRPFFTALFKMNNEMRYDIASSKNYPLIALFLCSFTNLILNAMISMFAPILPLVRNELNLSYTEGGLLTTAYFIGYTVGQIPWGFLCDRVGGSKTIALSLFTSSTATLALGSITSIGGAVLLRFLGGLLAAGIWSSGIRLISEWFPLRRRGVAIGILGAGTSLGGVFVSSTFPTIALNYGWRWCVWTPGAFGFIGSVILLLLLKDASDHGNVENKSSGNLKRMFLGRSFWVLGYVQFVRLGISYGLSAWLPTFLFENYGLSLFWAGMALTLINVVGFFSNPLGGVASDRFGEAPIIMVSQIVLTPCFIVLAIATNLALAWILVLLFGCFINFFRGPMFALLPKLYGREVAGRATGFQNTFASAGAFVFPLIIGYSRDQTASFDFGWISMAIFCGAGAILALLLRHALQKSRASDARADPKQRKTLQNISKEMKRNEARQ